LRSHSDAVIIPDARLLFSGDYERSGTDLIVSDPLHRVVVPGYFHGDKRPMLVSPEGAQLDPKVIEALTGHVQYAQAPGAVAGAKVVGHVVKMTGSASIVRNGVTIDLNNGDNVYQNDVVQTGSGSTLGLVMIDGTTFNLTANARLMMNDLTYDATSTSNTSLFTLVQGAASFVAGQVAKTGDMKVGTPVATMGIRGTAVILDISAVDGKVSISVIDQRDGQVHAVQVFNTRGDLIGTVTSNGSTLTLTPTATFEVIAQESNKTVAQVALEFNAFQQVLSTYDVGKQLVPSTPAPTDGRRGDATPQTTTKFAGTTIIPSDSSVTKFNADIASTKDVKGDAGTADAATQKPTGDLAGAAVKVAVVVGDTPLQVLNVPVGSIPFVVTPSPVSRISSGSGDHFGPVMSADGQFVTYDPDGAIFLFDRQSGATTTIASPGGGFTYSSPTISADGRFIVYQGSDGTGSFIFIYNNNASDSAHYGQTTRLMSGGQPAISGDGSKIVVERGGSIGLYDQQGHELANITGTAAGTTGTLWKPAISADGHIIAFWSSNSSSPGGAGQLITYDLSTATVKPIASTATDAGSSAASFSADGHFVVYQSDAGGHSEIYLHDVRSGQVVFHTANTEASYSPVISPDGHFIIFASDARLTTDDKNNITDIYVVDVTDLARPAYKLVSVLDDGTQGNAASNLGATISAGGQFVAFGSSASNFATGDTPGTGDIFVVDSGSGHSAIILEGRNSPAVLTANGVVKLTGDHSGVTLGVSDTRITAAFDSNGDIQWRFSEQRSDFASLQPGEISVQNFFLTLSTDRSTTNIPLKISIYDVDQAPVPAADAAPVANPVTLAAGTEDTTNTITSAALLAGVVDIDGPSLSITSLGIASGGGTIVDNHDGTFRYTPAPNYDGPVVFNYTASDGTLSASSTASLNIANVNDAPIITSAAFAVSEGGTTVLAASNFAIADPDSASFTFTVSNVTHGKFQTTADGSNWIDSTAFSTAQLIAGHVRFIHDGGEDAPGFSIRADDGAAFNHASAAVAGVVDFINTNDAPTVSASVTGGGAESTGPATVHLLDFASDADPDAVLHVANLVWTDTGSGFPAGFALGPDGNSITVDTNNLAYNALAEGETFTAHFGYDVVDQHGASVHQTAAVTIAGTNDAPTITSAGFSVSEGGTVVLGAANIGVVDPDSASFTFTITNVTHGTFQRTLNGSTWVDVASFSTADLNAGDVRFVHDGSELAPTFSIRADDGALSNSLSTVRAGNVAFSNVNDAPVITTAALIIAEGGTAVLGPSNVAATDPDNNNFVFTVSNVSHGSFQITTDGTNWVPVTTFNSANLGAGHVRFVHDGGEDAPTFSIQADDGAGGLSNVVAGSVSFSNVNDAPTVSSPVAGGGAEGTGPATVHLLDFASDADPGAVLHVANLVWTDTGSGFPAGFTLSPDGNSIAVDTNNLAYNGLAQGQAFTAHFGYDVVDEHGASVHQTAAITIAGTNDAPAITSAGFSVSEGGTVVLQATNIGVGDPDSTSFLFTLTNVTHGAFQKTVNGSTWVDTTTFSTADLAAGHVRFVHDGGEAAPTFSIRADDGEASNHLSATTAGAVQFTNVNDVPAITGVDNAVVHEDDTVAARTVTHQFTATDPDDTTAPVWTVEGGTTPHAAQYSFRIEEFKVTRTGSGGFGFDDNFNDGNAPSDSTVNAPNFVNSTVAASYATTGSFVETHSNGGFVTMDAAHAVAVNGVGTGTPFEGNFATLLTDTSTAAGASDGLRQGSDFTVEGTFGLTNPAELRQGYGIRLTDRVGNAVGNDTLDLIVREASNGVVAVQLRHVDQAADTVTTVQSVTLAPTPQEDHILLRLSHLANSSAVSASFDLYAGSTYSRTISFSATDDIFHGETFTRAGFFADSPSPSISWLNGIYGALSIDSTGAWSYTLNNGSSAVQSLSEGETVHDVFTVDASDGHPGGTAQRTVTIDVVGKNDAPTVTALTAATTEDGPIQTFDLLSGAHDAESDPLTVQHFVGTARDQNNHPVDVSGASGAGAIVIGPHTVTIDPHYFDYLGAGQSVTLVGDYDVFDGRASTHNTATLTINGVNDAPVAATAGNAASGNEDSTITGNVPAGSDVDDASGLTYALESGPAAAQGALTFNSDGTFSFAPAANFNGGASFSYRVVDPHGAQSDPQNFIITVNPVNDAPVAATTGNTASGNEDHTVTGSVPGGSDVDDASGLTYALVAGPAAAQGALTFNSDGTFSFAPAANFNGGASFSYRVVDPHGAQSDPQNFIITVNPVNDAPVAATAGNTASGNEDTTITGSVPAGSDVDDASGLTYALVTGPAALTFNSDGTFSFAPAADFNGTASFSYRVVDPHGAQSDPQSFIITVNPVNDAPVAATAGNTASGNEDHTITGSVPAGSDVDDASGLTYALVTGPAAAQGALTFNSDGTFSFAPAANFNGGASFSYRVVDPHGAQSDPQNFIITVNPVNDAPTVTAVLAKGDSAGTATPIPETDGALTTQGTLTVTDPDKTDPVTVSVIGVTHSGPTGGLSDTDLVGYLTVPGTAVLAASQTSAQFTWHFDSDDEAFDFLAAGESLSLHYTIQPDDSHPQTGTGDGTVTINIAGSNDAPDISGATLAAVNEDTLQPAGETVATLFAGKFHDVDDGSSFKGIAVVGNDATSAQGTWQYKTPQSAIWEDVGSVDAANALVFSTATMLRFVPAPDFNGSPGGLQVLGVDDTYDDDFTVGSALRYTENTTDRGGTTPFSANTATLDTSITPVDDKPVVAVTTPDNHVLSSTNGFDPARTADQTLQLTNLGISGDTDVTVEFWADFGSSVAQMPVGFYLYDLDFADFGGATGRAIGFNTGNGDLFGVARGDLVDQWHHYAAVFHNGDATQSKLYIDGQLQTLTQIVGSSYNPWAAITDSPRIGGWDWDSLYSIDGKIDDVRIWHGARSASDIAADTAAVVNGPQQNLVAAYSFENVADGPGGVSDVTGNGHGGTLIGLTAASVILDRTLLRGEISEDGALVFSSANQNAVSVSDVDDANLSLSLTVSHGNVTLASLNGLTITGGANSTAALTVHGLASDINAALQGLSYGPTSDYNGFDALTVTVSDGVLSDTKTIKLVVDPVDDAPVAQADAVSTDEDTATTFSVLANDTDPENDALTPALIVGPSHGTLTLNANSTFTYTPDANFNGTDMFTYAASDRVTTGNLIVNPGAELGPASPDFATVNTPQGWTHALGNFTAVNYIPGGADPANSPAITGGHAYFFGGPASGDGLVSQVHQIIDVSSFAADVDSGVGLANLSGYFGGFGGQDDNMTLTARFLDAGAVELGSTTVGGVSAADRGGLSDLLYRSGQAAVPVGTRAIDVVLTATKAAGSDNDGYADNVSLTLSRGGLQSAPATVTINVNPVNDAPVLNTHGASLTYTENHTATVIDAALTLSDVDSATLASAKVQITANYASGEDLLGFTDTAKIHGSFDAGTGTITLTPVAGQTPTVADFETALRSVTYFNSSDNPSAATRTASFQVDDGSAANHASNVGTVGITVAPLNDSPAIAGPNPVTASVQEDVTTSFSGHFTSSDPDGGAPVWSVVGGTSPHPADYAFKALQFKLTGGGGTASFDDTFAVAPQNDTVNYFIPVGSFATTSGGLLLDDEHAGNFVGDISGDNFVGQYATRTENLNKADAFTLEGRFSLVIPADVRNGYGIVLTDAHGGGGNGNDALELMVQRGENGAVRVRLRDIDFSQNTDTTLATSGLTGSYLADDQIVLRAVHTADSSALTFSYDLLHANGTPFGSGQLGSGTLFNGENTTRAEIFGYGLATAESYLTDPYGALSIDQAGAWTYSLRNGTSPVQALTQNDHVSEAFSVQVADGNGGFDTRLINLTVNGSNDAPVNTVPGSKTVNEDTTLAISGVSVSDIDTASLTTTLHVSNGVLNVATSGATVSGGNTATVTLSGSAAQINTALAGLTYKGASNYSGPDTLSVQTSDGSLSDIDNVAITVTAVNDAPAGTDSAVTTAEDTSYTFTTSDFGLTDPNDSPANSLLAVKITTVPAAGALKDNGVTVTAGQFVPLSDIVAGQLKFTPAANASGNSYTSFTFQVQDNGGTANGGVNLDPTPNTITVNVTPVNDAPVVNFNPGYLKYHAGDSVVGPVSTWNIGAGSTDGVTLEGWVNWDGSTTGNQIPFYNGSGSTAGFGPIGEFLAPGLMEISILSGGVDVHRTNVSIAANQWHHIALTRLNGTISLYLDGALAATSNQGVNPITTADDANPNNVDSTYIGPSGSIAEVRVWNVARSGAEIAASMSSTLTGDETGLVGYWPLNDGSGTIALDHGHASDTHVVGTQQNLTITGATWSAGGAGWPVNGVATNEDTVISLRGLSISDVDAGGGAEQVTLAVGHGALALGDATGVSVTQDGSLGTLRFTGSVAAINAALATGLNFTPTQNYGGGDTLSFTVDDQGNSGSGGAQSSTRQFAIGVAPANDAPAGANATVATAEDSVYTFTTADFGFSDPNDSPANSLLAVKITTVPSAGSLKDNNTTVTAGQFVPLSDIVAGQLKFTPAANASGNSYTSFTFQVQDNGGTANGGVDLDPTPNTIAVNVTAVNDAPVLSTHSNTISYTENATAAKLLSTVTVSDADAPASFSGGHIQVTLSNTVAGDELLINSGTVTLSGAQVRVSGTTVGTISSGSLAGGATAVTIDLNASATAAAVNNVLQAVAYHSSSDNPTNATRTATVVFDDGGNTGSGGPLSDSAAVTINVTPANDAPVIGGVSGPIIDASTTSNGSLAAGGISANPVITPDGHYVVFQSDATNLIGGDTNGTTDIFRKDLITGEIVLISTSSSNVQGNGASTHAAISADGRYTVFQSTATNLDPADTNTQSGIYLKDWTTGQLTLLSKTGAGVNANNGSFNPSISADGHFVAFDSVATNLVTGDTNGSSDVFVVNLQTNTISLVSKDSTNTTQGNAGSFRPALSSDGAYIAFDSSASNLIAGQLNDTRGDTFIKNLATGAIAGVDVSPTGQWGSGGSGLNGAGSNPALSADGQYVSFRGGATNLVLGVSTGGAVEAVLSNTRNGATSIASSTSAGTLAPIDVGSVSISADGRFVAFDTRSTALGGVDPNLSDVFLKDTLTGALIVVDRSAAGLAANSNATSGSVSSDGRYVAFASAATNLVAGDTNNLQDIFVKDTGVRYVENAPAVAIASALTLNDPDNASLAGATVSISGNFTAGQDVLSFTAQPGISGNYNPVTGILTFSGTASVAAYQAVLQSVSYANSSDAPSAATRTISFQVNDGTVNSAAVTANVIIEPVNDAPVAQPVIVNLAEDVSAVGVRADYADLDAFDPHTFTINTTGTAGSVSLIAGSGPNIIINGSFEDLGASGDNGSAGFVGTANPFNGVNWNDTATLFGWQHATTFPFELVKPNGTIPGNSGSVVLDLEVSSGGQNSDIYQDIPGLAAGSTYRLSFDTAKFQSFTGTVEVFWNGAMVSKVTPTSQSFSTTYVDLVAVAAGTGVGGQNRLEFREIGAGTDGVGTILDNVQLHPVGPSDATFSFTPTPNFSGQTSFTYTVTDTSGAASTATVTVNIAAVNDAPAGTDALVTTAEDVVYTFTAADFGFTDPNDSPANSLLAVKITSVPGAGSLTNNNVAVTAGQFVSVSDITSGKLTFTPSANANGNGYAGFSFQVRDNGGTANGGVDLDPTPNTITINVTAVNDAPVRTTNAAVITADEDTNPAVTVATLFSGKFTDVDSAPSLKGIAVTGSGSNPVTVGSWQYSTDNGANWLDFGTISASSALLLSADTLLRFSPVLDVNGLVQASSAVGVDDSYAGQFTSGATRVTMDLSADNATGGSTPFSNPGLALQAQLNPVNDAPRFSTLGPAAANTEQQFSLLDSDLNASVFDPELSTLGVGNSGNWSGTTLTLSRHGGANPEDVFNITADANGFFSVSGNQLMDGGQTIGTFASSGGVLTINFGPAAVSGIRLNKIVEQISYKNTSDNPSPSVVIDYAFNDNNTGNTQGSGGPQTGTASVTVNITPVNDAPIAHDDTISSTPGGWVLDADNGHAYRLVEHVPNFVGATWAEANAQANTDGAYLATITSATEQTFVANLVGARLVWIGGSDDASQGASEGAWKWVAGPEAGTQFWAGGRSGSAVAGQFAAWESGEPSSSTGENYLMFQGNVGGLWNDAGNGNQIAFVEEKGAPGAVFANFTEDTATTITATTLLANDSDADSLNLSITAVGATSAHGGSVSLANNLISYTPAANFNGADSFTYTVSDGSLTSSAAASFNVAAVNDAPVANNDSYVTDKNTTLTVAAAQGVLANDTDIDSAAASLTAALVGANGGALHGTVTLNSNGSFTYAPASNYTGTDSFAYRTSDGSANSSNATVNLTINASPVANGDSFTTPYDAALTLAPAQLLGNDTYITPADLSITSVQNPLGGTVAIVSGNVVFTPVTGYFGPAAFSYTVADGHGGTATATVAVQVIEPSVAGFDTKLSSEGNLGGRAGWTSSNPVDFNMLLGSAGGTLTILANDIENPAADHTASGELDHVFVNGHDIGVLTQGTDGADTTTVLAVDPAFIVSGYNDIKIYNTSAPGSNFFTVLSASYQSPSSGFSASIVPDDVVRQSGSSPAGNLGVRGNWTIQVDPAHPHPDTFTIALSSAAFTHAALTISAKDVELPEPSFPNGEEDQVFVNGHSVGFLAQTADPQETTNSIVSTTSLNVDPSFLVSGNNLISIYNVNPDQPSIWNFQVDSLTLTGDRPAQLISTENVEVSQSGFNATIKGISISDNDPSASQFTVAATADHGSMNPAIRTGNLSDTNSFFAATGESYAATASPANDKVAVTVTDNFGAADTVNVIFNVAGTGPNITLQGTAGKDIIVATAYQDTLTGGAGSDQFIFKANTGNDTITDFTPGQDKIDLHDFSPFDSGSTSSFNAWLNSVTVEQQGADTLIHLDASDSILLSNVVKASLHMSDFILHPGFS
jgi:VCBS repeat-containing protein